MNAAIHVRLANPSDLPQLKALSQTAEEAAHWTPQQWLDIFHSQTPPRLAWIAEIEPTQATAENPPPAVGFLIAQHGAPEWELENIAVLPHFRRQGIARALLSALLLHARSLLAERILLEVRASNQAAIRFYQAGGFQNLARRRDYYSNPTEDALIFAYPFPR